MSVERTALMGEATAVRLGRTPGTAHQTPLDAETERRTRRAIHAWIDRESDAMQAVLSDDTELYSIDEVRALGHGGSRSHP